MSKSKSISSEKIPIAPSPNKNQANIELIKITNEIL
jgi:hypothetical protein